ncbi:hypothetical protein [Pseudomonas aeruginosa]|uniref:hypothetical protein n=2 Tax=Pseudomonas aeruginosa TaxID=287 RepID=UPI001CBC34D2|nr:hypothetical protein [Pseudomonas aeruginosa]
MARKATPVKVDPMPEINQEALQEEVGALTMMGDIAQGAQEERDLVNQILGQVQMARSIARFADVVSLSKLSHIKETKLYRALQGKKVLDPDGNEIADVGTWDGFCQALGLSRSKVDEDLTNLNTFGEEALKQLSAIGAGYRELRQYRKLPDDQKTALIEVAKTGDKEAFVDLAEEMIAKHSKEKEELQAKLEDVQQDYDALSKVEADTSKKLRDVKLELQRAQLRTAPWSEKVAPFQEEIAKRQVLIDEALGRHLQAVEALDAWWIGEAVNQPGYDPEAYVEMPLEVRTVLIELDDAITRTAHLVAAARDQILNRFGDELALARQHQLQPEEQAQ